MHSLYGAVMMTSDLIHAVAMDLSCASFNDIFCIFRANLALDKKFTNFASQKKGLRVMHGTYTQGIS